MSINYWPVVWPLQHCLPWLYSVHAARVKHLSSAIAVFTILRCTSSITTVHLNSQHAVTSCMSARLFLVHG